MPSLYVLASTALHEYVNSCKRSAWCLRMGSQCRARCRRMRIELAYCVDGTLKVVRQIRAACNPIQAAFVQKKT